MAEEQAEQQTEQAAPQQSEPKYTQKDLDDFAARARGSFERKESELKSELEELRQFRQEHQKQNEELAQRDLEAKKKYDEALQMKEQKLSEYQKIVSEKETAINELQISHAIDGEIMRQGLYPEASQLIKSNAVLEDGVVKIKGKDANNIDSLLSVEEGVKQFKQTKPYLARAASEGGAGTSPASSMGGQNANNKSDADALQEAMRTGNRAEVHRLKQLIRAKHGASQN